MLHVGLLERVGTINLSRYVNNIPEIHPLKLGWEEMRNKHRICVPSIRVRLLNSPAIEPLSGFLQ